MTGDTHSASRSVLAVCLALLMVLPASATAAPGGGEDSTVTVALDADGSALLSVTHTYDLTDPTTADAFEALSTDDDAIAELLAVFETDVEAVAAAAEAETNREMTIGASSVVFEATDTVGTITFQVAWGGFASVEDDRLVVTEPLASGLAFDGRVVIVPPAGYEVAASTPLPVEHTDEKLVWSGQDSLDGFELALTADAGVGSLGDEDEANWLDTVPSLSAVVVGLVSGLLALGVVGFLVRVR